MRELWKNPHITEMKDNLLTCDTSSRGFSVSFKGKGTDNQIAGYMSQLINMLENQLKFANGRMELKLSSIKSLHLAFSILDGKDC